MANDSVVLRWSAYERDHIERENDWYWALGIAAVAIALTSILLQNVLFAVLILAAAATIALLARTPPELTHFEISERGVRAGEHMHRYRDIIGFWVEEERGGKSLLLIDTVKWLTPNLIIPIEGIDPALVRAYLKEHAKEVQMREPLPHKLLEFIGL